MAILDDFNRSNGDIGSNYVRVFGSNNFNISSNQLVPNNTFNTTIMRRTEASFPNDQYSQLDVSFTTGANSSSWAAGCRIGTSGEGYYAIYGLNNVSLYKRNASTPTYITDVVITAAANTLYTSKIEAIGTNITVYHQGVQVINVTDATYSSGKPGIWWSGNSDAPVADNFECSNASGDVTNQMASFFMMMSR